jgi:hypothetical protein
MVEELLARQPATAAHHLVFHHGDVRGRAAEGDGPELQEEPRELAERGPGDGRPPLAFARTPAPNAM